MSKTGIKVPIIGTNGNVFNLLGICKRALQRERKMELWDEFYKKATSGDYNHVLVTISDYFEICEASEMPYF